MAGYKDLDKRRATARKYYQSYRKDRFGWAYHRAKALVRMYGITEDEYARLFKEQGGRCAICRRPETAKRKGKLRVLCVDHDHATKVVRGLLCSSCNRAIGYLGDDPLRAHALMRYLEQHG